MSSSIFDLIGNWISSGDFKFHPCFLRCIVVLQKQVAGWASFEAKGCNLLRCQDTSLAPASQRPTHTFGREELIVLARYGARVPIELDDGCCSLALYLRIYFPVLRFGFTP